MQRWNQITRLITIPSLRVQLTTNATEEHEEHADFVDALDKAKNVNLTSLVWLPDPGAEKPRHIKVFTVVSEDDNYLIAINTSTWQGEKNIVRKWEKYTTFINPIEEDREAITTALAESFVYQTSIPKDK